MKHWSRHADILNRLQCLWNNGKLLAASQQPKEQQSTQQDSKPLFPLRIPLKKPTSRELDSHFEVARRWVAQWQQNNRKYVYTLEWKAIQHRVHGKNRLPVAVNIENREQAAKLLGKWRECQRYDQLCAAIQHLFPELKSWLIRKPHKVLEHVEDWTRLLAFMRWLTDHPRPAIYLRQIDLPDIHSKFIEQHRALLIELLDQVLPHEHIDQDAHGVKNFEQRYGFLGKPVLIRFRLLDHSQSISGLQDISIPLADFQKLKPATKKILIVENEITFLALPELPDTLAIFGKGYALDALANIPWLTEKQIHYWSDLDTHGFVMLNQLRQLYSQTQSLLMDEETLWQHQSQWGVEDKPAKRTLTMLTAEEQAVYQGLLQQHWQQNLRLEQEFIRYDWVKNHLRKAL